MHILNCFRKISWLIPNLVKTKLYSVGICDADVEKMARCVWCSAISMPFIYLGFLVATNMTNIAPWEPMVKKVKNRLSSWKAKSLLISGRLTLMKSILWSLPLYHISMFRAPTSTIQTLETWEVIFFVERPTKKSDSMEEDGLEVGSRKANKLACLGKWWLRYKKKDVLWWKIIKSI